MSIQIWPPFWGCRIQFPPSRLFLREPDNSVAPTEPHNTDNNSQMTSQTTGPLYRPIRHIISTSPQTYLPQQSLKVSLRWALFKDVSWRSTSHMSGGGDSRLDTMFLAARSLYEFIWVTIISWHCCEIFTSSYKGKKKPSSRKGRY